MSPATFPEVVIYRLNEAGFSVSYERTGFDPEHPVWRATARCDGREWSVSHEDLNEAFLELEKQAQAGEPPLSQPMKESLKEGFSFVASIV